MKNKCTVSLYTFKAFFIKTNYSEIKLAGRFSAKAVMPSKRSFCNCKKKYQNIHNKKNKLCFTVENVAWKVRLSYFKPSCKVVSYAVLTASLQS